MEEDSTDLGLQHANQFVRSDKVLVCSLNGRGQMSVQLARRDIVSTEVRHIIRKATSMSQKNVANPAVLSRANYMKVLSSYALRELSVPASR